jgi:hypothetical protein
MKLDIQTIFQLASGSCTPLAQVAETTNIRKDLFRRVSESSRVNGHGDTPNIWNFSPFPADAEFQWDINDVGGEQNLAMYELFDQPTIE